MRLSFLSLFAAAGLFAGSATSQVVINEIYYDHPGADDGFVFVELFGPAGFDVSGWTLQAIEGVGGSASGCNPDTFTFPAASLIPADGVLVVADELGSTGTTMVANADFIVGDMDLENGPDALQLLDDAGDYVDAVAYGAVDQTMVVASCNGQAWFEGTPARDAFAPLSIERCPAGSDSDDNSIDLKPNQPTPGVASACCEAIEWVSQGNGNSISAGNGESVGFDFWLTCGAGENYLMLAALTDPTLVPPPPPFPVLDGATPLFLSAAGAPPFVAWSGTMPASGELVGAAALDFSSMPLPGFAQFDMWIGAVTFDASFNLTGTNAVQVTIEM